MWRSGCSRKTSNDAPSGAHNYPFTILERRLDKNNDGEGTMLELEMRGCEMRTQKAAWLLAAVVVAAGCATATVFSSTWRNPATKPVRLEGQKVVALVIYTGETTRRMAEDAVAGQITARGAQGVAAWTILPTAEMQDEAKTRAALAQAGAVGVITMEVVGQDRDSRSQNVSMSLGSASRGSFWANYNWAWRNSFHSGPSPTQRVWVETLLYSLEPDELVWAGRSRTVNTNALAALFGEVANAAAREMDLAGLIKGPS